MNDKVVIRRLQTGVPGLDEVLGGGLSEFSFNLLAGSPGSGKTTLAHQIMFALANPARKALFFTVLGEPPIKMLRYQQQYSFFDIDKINDSIRFVNLSGESLGGDYSHVLARVIAEVEAFEPGLVFVDSFRSVTRAVQTTGADSIDLAQFIQQLGIQLTGWQATTFLLGEYVADEGDSNPVFTVADGIVWLSQATHRNSMVRKLQVTKMRGQAPLAGMHTFRISDEGIRIFPRIILNAPLPSAQGATENNKSDEAQSARVSMGVAELDKMLGGGLPRGYSLLVVGPSGSGKSTLASQFLAEGIRRGEPGVIAAFEKSPTGYHNHRLESLIAAGSVGVVDTRALDLSIDETLFALTEMIDRMGAKRVVIDSLSGFELALAPTFREDFRETLHRMVAALSFKGMTVLLTAELEDRYFDLRFSPTGSAFLTDAIIVQRYVEMEGVLKRLMAVVKVRNSQHAKELRLYEIDETGLLVEEHGDKRYGGLLTGQSRPNE